jgi:UDP-N-acetyl-D-glucosamine dehydrogenase
MTRLEELSEWIDSRRAQIGVIGLGYVGLPLALEFAKAGFRVTGFELDEEKVRTINAGGSYIDDVSPDEVKAARDAGRLEATLDYGALSRTDVIIFCVQTPLT